MSNLKYTQLFDVVITAEKYDGVELSLLAKLIYCKMCEFDRNTGKVFMSNTYLADLFCTSTRSVTRATKELQDVGLIKGVMGHDCSKTYTILVKPEEFGIKAKTRAELAESNEVGTEHGEQVNVAQTAETSLSPENFIEKVEAVEEVAPVQTTTAQEFLATVTEEPASLVPSLEELLASAPVVDVVKVKAEAAARNKAKEEEAAIIAKEKAQYEAGTLKATRSLFNK